MMVILSLQVNPTLRRKRIWSNRRRNHLDVRRVSQPNEQWVKPIRMIPIRTFHPLLVFQRILLYRNHPIQPIGPPWIQWLLRMFLDPTRSLVRLLATRLVPALLKLRRLPAPVSALAGCLPIESTMMVLHHDRVLKVCARNRVFNDNYGRLLDVQRSPIH
jgi:hypothetical protein